LPVSTSTNYLNWVNTEAVRFVARRTTGTTPKAVRIALRQSATLREARTAGITLSGQELLWNLPVALLGSVEPQAGDAIVDSAGITWAVTGPVQKLGRGSRWKLLCIRER
jgi:hypothetical protein